MVGEMLIDPALYAAGALLLAAAARWWRPELPRRWAAGHALLVLALFAPVLATPRVQVPVDIAYQWRPWRAMTDGSFEPANELLSDIPLQMLPFRTLVRQRLLAGEAPLWAHEVGTGQPLLGNAQSAPFAPLHLMSLPVPPIRGLTLAAAWQVLLALLLTHALVLGLSSAEGPGPSRAPPAAVHAGAAAAALAYALSSWAVAWLYHPLSMVAAWLPGLFLGIVALARGERRAMPGLVVCAVGAAVSGHPETLAHGALVAAGLGAVLLVLPGRGREPGPAGGWAAFLRRASVAALLAFALAAPAVLPVLEEVPRSERMAYLARGPGAGVDPPPFEPRALLPLVQPLSFGSPRDGDWEGPVNWNEYATHYAGLLTLGLALGGAAFLHGRILALLVAGGAALGVALNVPPLYEAFDALPGLGHAAHARLRLFWVLAVALAAGLTLARLPRASRRQRLGLAAALLGVAVAAALAPPRSLDAPLRAAWWVAALAGPLVAAALLAVRRWRPAAAWVVPAALLLDLALLGVRYHPLIPPGRQLEATESLAWLVERSEEAREPFRVAAEGWDLLPNTGAVFGLWDPRGNDPMRPAGPLFLIGRGLGAGHWRPGTPVLLRRPWNTPLLAGLGVRYVLTVPGRRQPEPWRLAFSGVGGNVWEHPDPLSLFWVPERARPVWRETLARRISLSNNDFRELAVYFDRRSTVPGFHPPRAQEGEAWIRRVTANGFELVTRVRSEGEGGAGAVVASSVSDAPGWRLRIDGEPATTLTVGSAFVGFRAPPGVHRAELVYSPVTWRWGLGLFAVGAVASLLLAGRALAGRSLRASAGRPPAGSGGRPRWRPGRPPP